eukprot:GHVR01109733.1.p1 GENE.GHVR01109733.1~~GHVR01109733.1.p1  ORF type:complete len:193 (+),score=79.51 GHVR01109733.1:81-659(+)
MNKISSERDPVEERKRSYVPFYWIISILFFVSIFVIFFKNISLNQPLEVKETRHSETRKLLRQPNMPSEYIENSSEYLENSSEYFINSYKDLKNQLIRSYKFTLVNLMASLIDPLNLGYSNGNISDRSYNNDMDYNNYNNNYNNNNNNNNNYNNNYNYNNNINDNNNNNNNNNINNNNVIYNNDLYNNINNN